MPPNNASSETAATGADLATRTRAARRLGLTVAMVFFSGLGLWSWLAPLSTAAIATGVVVPQDARRTVQHLEGGIVAALEVDEGDHVAAGDVLLTLDSARAGARLAELEQRRITLAAMHARLRAQVTGAGEVVFGDPPQGIPATDHRIMLARQNQRLVFSARQEAMAAQRYLLSSRIGQYGAEIAGLRQVSAALDDQIALIGEELVTTRTLYQRGLQRMGPYLALQRQEAALRADHAATTATISRLSRQIDEAKGRIRALEHSAHEGAVTELARVAGDLAAVAAQIPQWADAVARATVRAPVAGRVFNIRLTGGVLPPGGDILDIVPEGGGSVVAARIHPADIDAVAPGMVAQVLPGAYPQRNLPRLIGTVQSVSADRLIDDRTGAPYFLARIRVTPEALAQVDPQMVLSPGMPAEVIIPTGDRTLIGYLLAPIVGSLRRGLREG